MARARGEAGFTLIELIIALLVSSLVAGMIFQVLRGQGRFVAQQTAREEVLQNARGALDVMGSELRAMHPQGLVLAESDSIEFYSPRAWGLVCAAVSSGASQLTAIFPDVPDMSFEAAPNGSLPSTAGVQIANSDAAWPAVAVASLTNRTLANCAGIAPGATNLRVVRFATASGNTFPAIEAGTRLYYFQRVRYSLGSDPSVSGTWVMRTAGKSAGTLIQKPFAGPVSGSGPDRLRFWYYRLGQSAPDARLGTLALRTAATRVGVRVTTESRSAEGGPRPSITDSLTIHLRNQGAQ